MALLGKWWWMLKKECSSLWFGVLVVRFGEGSLFVYADVGGVWCGGVI